MLFIYTIDSQIYPRPHEKFQLNACKTDGDLGAHIHIKVQHLKFKHTSSQVYIVNISLYMKGKYYVKWKALKMVTFRSKPVHNTLIP